MNTKYPRMSISKPQLEPVLKYKPTAQPSRMTDAGG
jgi:hypothetical protein